MGEKWGLTKLVEWLRVTGRSKAWFARQVGYSYQTAWGKLKGSEPLTDRFVVACFVEIPDLPGDVFEAQGYVREDGFVYRRIALEASSGG